MSGSVPGPLQQNPIMRIVGARRHTTISPLRYPGGKASLAGPLANLINTLGSHITCYVEPYAGGVGAGITLLHEGIVDRLVINDIDPAVYSFWKTVTTENDRLVEQISKVPLTVEEWKRQRAIYRNPNTGVGFELGFAFFYLNRTNRSGILTGGVIGGLQQNGAYKIDARFNRETLVNRIRALSEIGDRIEVTAKDGRTIIREYAKRENTFMYVDPPYVKAGSRLYLKSFDRHDHINLAGTIKETAPPYWLMTYDDTPLVRELYQGFPQGVLELAYSTNRKTRVEELVVASPKVAAAIHYVS